MPLGYNGYNEKTDFLNLFMAHQLGVPPKNITRCSYNVFILRLGVYCSFQD